MEEFEAVLDRTQSKAERNKQKCERLDNILTEAKAGFKHLVEKLNLKFSDSDQQFAITEETLVEAINITEEDLNNK